MIICIFFSLAAVAVLVVLMFRLATLALPLLAAISAGRLAFAGGAGVVGATLVGLIAGVATLAAGQLMLALHRSNTVRLGVAVVFAAPAAYAGYYLVLGFSRLGGAQGVWQPMLAGFGALVVGAAALGRLATPLVSAPVMIGPRPAAGAHGGR